MVRGGVVGEPGVPQVLRGFDFLLGGFLSEGRGRHYGARGCLLMGSGRDGVQREVMWTMVCLSVWTRRSHLMGVVLLRVLASALCGWLEA